MSDSPDVKNPFQTLLAQNFRTSERIHKSDLHVVWSPASTIVFLVASVGRRSQFGARLVDPGPVGLGKTQVLRARDILLVFEQE